MLHFRNINFSKMGSIVLMILFWKFLFFLFSLSCWSN